MSKVVNGIEYTHQTRHCVPLLARKLGEQLTDARPLELWAILQPGGMDEEVHSYGGFPPFNLAQEKKTRPRTLEDVKKLLASVHSPTLWIRQPKSWQMAILKINDENITYFNTEKISLSLNPFIENPVILGWEIEE